MIIAFVIALLLAFLFYASYSIRAGIYVKAFCMQKTKEKIVFLTFDDGPDRLQTPKVLDVLKEYHAPATFFCIGSKTAGNEAIIQRMAMEHHRIGNHSYSHRWNFPFYPARKMTADLKQCQATLEALLNEKVNLFRPPFGVTNPTISGVVKRLGYVVIGWNIRTLDTQYHAQHEKIIRRIRKRLRPGSIILLHDRMPQSEILLRKILDLLQTEQYKVVGLEL